MPISRRSAVVLGVVTLLVFTVGIAAVFDVLRNKRLTIEDSQRTLQALANVEARHIAAMLDLTQKRMSSGDSPAELDCSLLGPGTAAVAPARQVKFALRSEGPAHQWICGTPPDGNSAVLVALAAVPGHLLTVEATRPLDDILSGWRGSALNTLTRNAAAGFLALVLLLVVVRQFQRQEQINEELHINEQRWRAVFDHAPVGIIMLPPNTPYLIANPAFQQMVGYSLEDLKQLAPDDITHPDDISLTRAKVAELERATRTSVHFEKRYLHKSGRVVWTDISISRISEPGGQGWILIAVVEDMTEQRAAEDHRQRLESELRQSQKLEALGTFAGGIAHDFNNILGAILGYGDRAFRAAEDNPSLRRDLQQILNAGSRAKDLVQRILAFSQSGVTARLPVNVEAVVRETIDMLRAGLAPTIDLVSRLGAPDAHIVGDSTHLHQVVMNLCTNAAHAVEHGGTITVSTRASNLATARVLTTGTLGPGCYVEVCVADNGTGIRPEVQERMFDPFFTTRTGGSGTGLGLSLVNGIVREYGGGVDVVSAPGAGSSFTVFLPVTTQRPQSNQAQTATTPRGSGQCVLLVDDERPLLELMEDLLAELGYEPIGFTSAKQGFQAFLDFPERFDAILSDHAMPDMNGTEFFELIRKHGSAIPLLLVSGYGNAITEEQVRHFRVAELLHKPIARDELARALHAALHMDVELRESTARES